MTQNTVTQQWSVSLYAEIIARLLLPSQVAPSAEVASDVARSETHLGKWRAAKDPMFTLDVQDESVFKSVTVVSCRPVDAQTWDVLLEARITVRRTAIVEALTAHEARNVAAMENTAHAWRMCGDDGESGEIIKLSGPELISNLQAQNVTSA